MDTNKINHTNKTNQTSKSNQTNQVHTVSKTKNGIAFAFTIAAIALFSIGVTLFLVSSFVVLVDSKSVNIRVSTFDLNTTFAAAALILCLIAFLFIQWEIFLRRSPKISDPKALTLIILSTIFIFVGSMCLPSTQRLTFAQSTSCLIASIISTIFLTAGFIITVIFNFIVYKQRLEVGIILMAAIFVCWIVSAILCWTDASTSNFSTSVGHLLSNGATVCLWYLILKTTKTNIVNQNTNRFKQFSKIIWIAFWVFLGTTALLTIFQFPFSDEIEILGTFRNVIEFINGLVFTGFLALLIIIASSDIYYIKKLK